MDVFGPTLALQSRPLNIQQRFRAHADEAVAHYAFWHDQNMTWLADHLGDLQAQQKQNKSLATLMQSPAKKKTAGAGAHKHTKATAAGLQSPFVIQPTTLSTAPFPTASSNNNIFSSSSSSTKAKALSSDKENNSQRPPAAAPPPPAGSKRSRADMQSPAKPTVVGRLPSPGKIGSPMHKKTKTFPASPSTSASASAGVATKPPTPRELASSSASYSRSSPRAQRAADAENVAPPQPQPQPAPASPALERQRVVSAASHNTSGEDDDAMVEASLLAASTSSPQQQQQPSRATPASQSSKLPTPASAKVQNASNVSRSTTPPFSPEHQGKTKSVKSPPIRSHIPSPRALPSRAASPRTIPNSPSAKAMPPPTSTKPSSSVARGSPLKGAYNSAAAAHRHRVSLDSDDDDDDDEGGGSLPQELAKPMSPRALPRPQSKTPASSALSQPTSSSGLKSLSAKSSQFSLQKQQQQQQQQSHNSHKSTSSSKDKTSKRTSITIPQSPVSAFLASHQSRPSGLNFKGAGLRTNAAADNGGTGGNTSLFAAAPQGAGHTSLHYTSKAFTSMSYNTHKERERDENLPSRVLPPSLFGGAAAAGPAPAGETKDSEVPLKDEPSSQPGRSRVEALMNKVESLTKSMGASRASAIQRGDLSLAAASGADTSTSASHPSHSFVRPSHAFVRHESHDSHSQASTSFFSANDSQTSRTTDSRPLSKRSSFAAAVLAPEDDLMRFDETRYETTTSLAAQQQSAEDQSGATLGPSPSKSAGKMTESESTATLKQSESDREPAQRSEPDQSEVDDDDEAPEPQELEVDQPSLAGPPDSFEPDADADIDADQSASGGEEEEEEERAPEAQSSAQMSFVESQQQEKSLLAAEPELESTAPGKPEEAANASTVTIETAPAVSRLAKTPSLKLQSSTTGLKSLQKAAAAREKEQQERDRKNALKEEREQQRRIMAIAKQQEEERANKARAEAQAERKRKEPEEAATKIVRPPSSASKGPTSSLVIKAKAPQASTIKAKTSMIKPSDDQTKRRKVESDVGVGPSQSQSKPIIRIPAAQPARPGTAFGKYSTASTSASQPGRKLEASQTTKPLMASATKAKAPVPGPSKTPQASSSNLNGSMAKSAPGSNKVALPKTVGKLKAPQPVAHPPPPAPVEEPPEEEEVYEELPDIASEYSDSDDDTQAKKTAALPQWAQSPALKAQLQAQSRLDPDDIFGAVPELKLEDIFRGRKHQFRARSSSAHWSGPDALSRQEEVAYAKRMNFVSMHETQQQ